MKKYAVHRVYILFYIIMLLVLTSISINEIIDPTCSEWAWPVPRPLGWYLCAYLWYAIFTTAYIIEIEDGGLIRTKSLLKKSEIKTHEILSIKQTQPYVFTIIHSDGTANVSILIDGASNIKDTIQALIPQSTSEYVEAISKNSTHASKRKIILKSVFIFLLIAFAIYIQWNRISHGYLP